VSKDRVWLELDVTLGNGTSDSCSIIGSQKFWKYDSTGYFIRMIKGQSSFAIVMIMPLKEIKSIKAIEVKFVDNRRGKECNAIRLR